ncbi:MAG: M28 family peptidase [Acidobacteria bacterium]|nr:M28 family peptidase [Acidobacteriota bacterium]
MRLRSIAIAAIVVVLFGVRRTASAQDIDPRIEKLVASVSEERLGAILKKLESFETRSTLSSTTSTTRGIGAARQWILDELKSYSPKLQVGFDTYQVAKQGRITRDVEVRNVMAILPGRSPRRIYVSGHYDTVARPGGQSASNAGGATRDPDAVAPPPADPNAPLDNPAPGVNDDGSGTALTIELARVFSQSGIEFDATLALAPPPPTVTTDRGQPTISRAPSGYDANLKWTPAVTRASLSPTSLRLARPRPFARSGRDATGRVARR